jgi:hypothetical protein
MLFLPQVHIVERCPSSQSTTPRIVAIAAVRKEFLWPIVKMKNYTFHFFHGKLFPFCGVLLDK